MGKTVESADVSPVKEKKKSKKNKNKTDDDLLLFYDANRHVETDGDHSKKKKKDKKHREKKRKLESKEDVGYEENQLDKGNLAVSDDGLQKKKNKKRKRSCSSDEALVKENEPDQDVLKKTDKKKKKKKIDGQNLDTEKSEESTLKTRNIEDKSIEKLDKKKKKKIDGQNLDTEKTEESTLKTRNMEEKSFEKLDKKKKKKKIDGQNLDTEKTKESTLKTRNMEDKSVEKLDKKKKKKKIDGQNLDTEKTEESTLKTRNMEDKSFEKTDKKKKKKKIDGQNLDAEDKSMEKEKVKAKGRVKNKTIKSVENNTEKPKAKSKPSKKVRFSGHVEVFPTSSGTTETEKQATKEDGLVRGKRFTPEEDETVKQAVHDFITRKGLGEEGLKMVLNSGTSKGARKCWKEIAECLPNRPVVAVYNRAHNLFERCETRSWTPEEIELLRELHGKYGSDWKKISEVMGKHRVHVKDTWRRIKLVDLKKGRWKQEEYQNLYDLVNLTLQMKVSSEENKKSKYGMLRDNIPWTAISEKLLTRSDSTCCSKWYEQLTSPLVAAKKWSDADDYRMIGALYELDAACAEDVDWDNILEHRPGDICQTRWNQMVKHIGDYGSKPFTEQVDILAKRYCPDLAETRQVWDSRPVVP